VCVCAGKRRIRNIAVAAVGARETHTRARPSERTPLAVYASCAATLIASRPVIALLLMLLLFVLFYNAYYAQWRTCENTKFCFLREIGYYDGESSWYEITPPRIEVQKRTFYESPSKFNFIFLTTTYRYCSIYYSLQA